MLNLRNEKLNTVLNQVAANVSNLVGREVRRSNKNGMILAVDIVDFEDHVINLWFANAETAVEKRASDFQVWSTFMQVLRAKEKLAAKSIRSEHGNYVQFTTLEELPSVSFEFNPDSLNFTPSGLAPKAFVSDLRTFANTMSRRPYNEQAWFEKNFPTASNFGEALLMMLRNHNKTVKELFADNTDEVVELNKMLTSKLIQHKIYKEDLIQGNTTATEQVVTDETQAAVAPKKEATEKVSTDFGQKLSAAIKEQETAAEVVESSEPTEAEVKAEVDASTENSVEAEIKLQEIYSDLSKYHAAPNQGKQRKQMIRSLAKVSSIVENSEMLITLLEVVELTNAQREDYRNQINAAVSLAVAVNEDSSDLSELEDIADEFESETFENKSDDEEKFEESESDEEDEDDVFEFEGDEEEGDEDEDEDDEVTFEEDEDESEDDEDEVETDSDKEETLQKLISQGKGRLRQRARKLGMPLAKSCSSDVYALAEFIYDNDAA